MPPRPSKAAQKERSGPPIPPEIWGQILSHLVKPVPRALSCPHRSELRQDDLCSVVRVNKDFNSIGIPLLYENIVTDDLPSLFDNVRSPANQRRFEHTRSLHIEYTAKYAEAAYVDLCKLGTACWETYGRTPKEAARVRDLECNREVDGLLECLWTVKDAEEDCPGMFPKLDSIAVSAIYGEDMAWPLTADPREMRIKIGRCISLFHEYRAFICLPHFCYRQATGPLAMGPRNRPGDDSPLESSSTTIHFTADTYILPVVVGSPIAWVSDAPPNQNWAPLINKVDRSLSLYRAKRYPGDPAEVADLAIYCSTHHLGPDPRASDNPTVGSICARVHGAVPPSFDYSSRRLTEKEQRATVEELCPMYLKSIREGSGVAEDSIRWRPSTETPICPCCGSGSPV